MANDKAIVRKVRNADDACVYLPIASRVDLNIRPATLADLPFIDRLQKAQNREVGFLPTAALEGKVRLGQVLLAEQVASCQLLVASSEEAASSPATSNQQPATRPIGYLIAADRYFKRDEIGYITQINVLPEFRRSLVAGALLQAQFDRSAYGCKLYACWCAQDLKANEFWEAMGFTAIAFRTGSRSRGQRSEVRGQKRPRIHIFWQKRVRADDDGDVKNGGTPWWYPSQTGGGEMREDRLVFPIPPGVSWRDVLPVVLPESAEGKVLGAECAKKKPRAKKMLKAPRLKGGLWFKEEAIVEKIEPAKDESALAKSKIDPRLMAMARELRDRWTERAELILPGPAKHDVRRMIGSERPGDRFTQHTSLPALPEAA